MNYNTLFLSNNGTNVFTTLGFLKKIESKIDRTRWWNVSGSASLILFLKIIGHNWKQIFEILSDFSLTPSFINGSSLVPENEERKKKYIKEWLIEHLSDSEFFSKDIRLEEVVKKTNIFPAFVLYSRRRAKIINVNPKDNPKFKLIDCVMASLCYIGVYEEYEFLGDTFSNLSGVDCYPYSHISVPGEEDPSILYIGNIGIFDDEKVNSMLGPLSVKEGMLIKQYSEHEKYHIEKIFSCLSTEESVRLYSYYRRGKLGQQEMITLFKMGLEQGDAFEEKKDTHERHQDFVNKIESQS
jgi:hypothetical protein